MTKIVPSAGKWLTQASLEDEKERIFSDSVYLGVNDSEENWVETTEEARQEWEEKYLNSGSDSDEDIEELGDIAEPQLAPSDDAAD